MDSIERAKQENKDYNVAKKWLTENGIFKKSEISTRESKSLNSNISKRTYKITFQKSGSAEIKTDEGDDLKKLVIDMYRAEF